VVVIPEIIEGLPVTELRARSFYALSGVTRIEIPHTITSIPPNAIQWCYDVTNISVDVNSADFSSLEGILLDKAQTRLVQHPLGKPDDTYAIPGGVVTIGGNAFSDCGLSFHSVAGQPDGHRDSSVLQLR
jgi:hypothetical protein